MTGWIIAAGAIAASTALVLLGILLVVLLKRPGRRPTDYRSLFTMGIIFFTVGVAMLFSVGPAGIGLAVLGFIWLVTGLANRDKWERDV